MTERRQAEFPTTDLFGFRFLDAGLESVLAQVAAMAQSRFSYVVTPNVDFVIRAHKSAAARALYDGAAIQLCDSRVLGLAAKVLGERLVCIPGSDLVEHLMAQPVDGLRYCLVGPDISMLQVVRSRYPQRELTLLPTPPRFAPGEEAWCACVKEAAEAEWDVLLLCLGSPKQEAFAAELALLRTAPGVALCVGASIDFLAGTQRRAPRWMQRLALEWLFRLASNPRRLWRRYLIDNPQFLLIVARTWFKGAQRS